MKKQRHRTSNFFLQENGLVQVIESCLVLLHLLGSPVLAQTSSQPASPVFHASFDQGVSANSSTGQVKPAIRGQPSFTRGIRGKAVLVGGEDRLFFDAARIFDVRRGACTFWASNVDWTASTPTFQFMVSFVNERPNTDFLIYKPHNKTALAFLIRDRNKASLLLEKPVSSWRRGEWHHVAATWNEKMCRFFIDGELVRERPRIPLPVDGWRHLILGITYSSWAFLGREKTAIDEVRLFDRALSISEIQQQVEAARRSSPVLRQLHSERQAMLARLLKGNLALAKAGAAVITSSFENTTTAYSDNLIDGDLNSSWRSFDSDLPQWIELRWDYPVRVGRLEFYELLPSRMTTFAVHAWDGKGAWRDLHLRGSHQSGTGSIICRFDETLTDRLRLIVYGNQGPYTQVAEIAAYGPEQPLVGQLRPFWKSWHIWSDEPQKKVLMEPRYFRKEFEVPPGADVSTAFIQLYTNDLYEVLINGVSVAKGFKMMPPVDISRQVRAGHNCVAVVCTPGSQPGWPNMAMTAEMTINTSQGVRFCSVDRTWKVGRKPAKGWTAVGFDDRGWEKPLIIARVGKGIWGQIGYVDTAEHVRVQVRQAELTHPRVKPGESTRLRLHLRPAEPLKDDYVLIVEMGEKAVLKTWGDYTFGRRAVLPQPPALTWRTDRDTIVEIPLVIPEWAPHGQSPIRVEGLSLNHGPGMTFVVDGGRAASPVAKIWVDRFGKEMSHPSIMNAKVNRQGPSCCFILNGRKVPPFIHAYSRPTCEKIYLSARTGVHLYQVRGYPLKPEDGEQDIARICAVLDQQVRNIVRIDSEARFIAFLDLRPSTLWLSQHGSARLVNAFGKKGPQSYFSRDHEAFVFDHLRRVIREMQARPYGARIFAWHPETAGTPDSALGGTEDNLFVKDRNRLTLGDYNPEAIKAFQGWLRKKYGDSLEAFRTAWKSQAITFEGAGPDNRALTAEGAGGGLFRDPAIGAAPFDYFEFLSGAIWRFDLGLARVVKEETRGRALAGVYYGYNTVHLTGYNSPGSTLQNNNFDDDDMLQGRSLDYVAMVPSYGHRWAGSHFEPQCTLASHSLYHQPYICEIDTRTHTAVVKRHGRQRSVREAAEVLKRDAASLIMDGLGAWFADWSAPGTRGVGYFTDPDVLDVISRAQRIYRENLDTQRPPAAEIAVLVSGEAYFYHDILRAPPLYHNLIRRMMYQELPHIGAPYDVYRLEDLAHETVRRHYKLFILINPFVLDEKARKGIEAIKKDSKTILWFYAPGYVQPGVGLNPNAISDLTGLHVSLLNGQERMACRITDLTHPLTKGLPVGKQLSVSGYSYAISNELHPTAFKPLFCVEDSKATVLGEYPRGQSALAARDFGDWKSVYSAVPYMDRQMLRNVARYAGVHLYCNSGPVIRARGPFLMIHKGFEGPNQIRLNLREKGNVTELFEGRTLGTNTDAITLESPRCATWFLRIQ